MVAEIASAVALIAVVIVVVVVMVAVKFVDWEVVAIENISQLLRRADMINSPTVLVYLMTQKCSNVIDGVVLL
jgi:hypothetical protein